MKVTIRTLPLMQRLAEERVESHFSALALDVTGKQAEHAMKRRAAEHVRDGEDPPEWFVEAAKIEGISPVDLAALILSKPDTTAYNAIARRRAIVRVRQAKSQEDLERILDEERIPQRAPTPPGVL